MTLIKHENDDGTFTVYDMDDLRTVFNGTNNIQIPNPVFVGTVEKIQSIITANDDAISNIQNQLARNQAILDCLNNS